MLILRSDFKIFCRSALTLLQVVVGVAVANGQELTTGRSTIYYDADEINLDKETGNLKAKGNAFILLGNVFVSADSFEYNKMNKTMFAEGGVRVVRSRERITASRVLINEATNEARMDDVEIYADPKDTDAQVNEEVLGFSRAEIAFEVARQERSAEIIRELTNLRAEFANLQNVAHSAKKSKQMLLKSRYAQLLERLVRTKYQPSDVLRDLPEDARRRLENRREAVRTFAAKDPELAQKIAGLQKVPGYLSMKADRVFQSANQNMDVERASLTTCRCDPDDNPIWGLSASRALVEPNDYITLYGSTLEVGRFPLVYSPWFKMPIKTKRQSGFLLPSFYLSRAGDAFSLPYYQTLGEHADSTLTFTYFSKRGPRGEIDLRAALSEQSKFNIHGELLRQKSAVQDGKKTHDYRWAWSTQSNIPLSRRNAFKFDFEKMSDQKYFSDLTKEPGATQDLFTPQIIVRRFVDQDAALEHSGENFALSIRAQRPEDVFAANATQVPARLPRLDLTLHPQSIADSGLSWEGHASFENVVQSSLKDLPESGPRDGTRDGQRLRLNYTFPLNPYLNIKSGGEVGRISYKTQAHTGELSYTLADLGADIPLYANLLSTRSNDQSETSIRHNVTPFANIRWIPQVQRAERFPDIYSTFYSADNVARSQTLEFGINTDIQVSKDEFRAVERADSQTTGSGRQPTAPANENILFSLMKSQRPTSPQEAGQFLFSITTQQKNKILFDQWAEGELRQFIDEVRTSSRQQENKLLAIRPVAWRRTTKFDTRPIGLGLRSSYNFEALRTAAEQNRNLQAGQTPVSAEPWGDVIGTVSASAYPLLPVSASATRIWQPVWRQFKEQNNSLGISSSFGLSANFSRSVKRSEALDAQGQKYYPEEQIWGVDTSYQPRAWLRFQVQYLKTIKPQPAARAELEYSGLQKITFLGIQDCMDITLQRFKDRDIAERLATWTIGLNLSFLGQQRQVESLGKVVDRAIKSQLSKGQNGLPR
jgi:lipopolysaccharide export system protein LptA